MPTIGGGDDFVWIGGPDEGLWLLVVVGDEAIDGGLEIDDAFEDAALEAPLGEDGEETLDGVEPTGRGWRGPSCRPGPRVRRRSETGGTPDAGGASCNGR
jgi:hypothetical protein